MDNIKYVNVQIKNGIPYSYIVGIYNNHKIDTCRFCEYTYTEHGREVVKDFYPISILPTPVKNFINSSESIVTWWGSAGDESMYRIIRK